MSRLARRTLLASLMLLVGVALAAILVLSPVALGGLARLIPLSQWNLLSDVGQAYGPVATILTCLSLAGLAFSVFVQARTTHIANEQMTRMLHMELIRWAMDDPGLIQADGASWSGPQDDFEVRLYIYHNPVDGHVAEPLQLAPDH